MALTRALTRDTIALAYPHCAEHCAPPEFENWSLYIDVMKLPVINLERCQSGFPFIQLVQDRQHQWCVQDDMMETAQ